MLWEGARLGELGMKTAVFHTDSSRFGCVDKAENLSFGNVTTFVAVGASIMPSRCRNYGAHAVNTATACGVSLS